MDFIESMRHGDVIHIGWTHTTVGWTLMKETNQYWQVYLAALSLATCGLQLVGAMSMRLSRGGASLPMVKESD